MGWRSGLSVIIVQVMSIGQVRVPLPCRRSHRTWANRAPASGVGRTGQQPPRKGLCCGHRPQVEGIAGPAAFEALENVLLLIRGEAASCA